MKKQYLGIILLMASMLSCREEPPLADAPAGELELVDISSWPRKFIYLNLDRSPVRNKEMIAELNHAKVNYERFGAVDGKKLDFQKLVNEGVYDEETFKTSPLKAGEIGVYLSNIKYLESLTKKSAESLEILLEDDVIIPADVNDELNLAFKMVPKDWDLLYLGCYLDIQSDPHKNDLVQSPYNKNPRFSPVCRGDMEVVPGTPWLKLDQRCTAGAYAYTANIKHSDKILDLVKPIKAPIDVRYQHLYRANGELKAYCLKPNLIRTKYSIPSTIR